MSGVSTDNAALVRRWFEGFGRGELTLEICDPEIEITNWAEFPIVGPYVGHEGVRGWWDDIADAFENLQWELLDVIDVDERRVVTIQTFRDRFRLTGIDVDDFTWGAVVSVNNGRIASAIGYSSPGKAKRAAGLPRDSSRQ